MKPVRRENPDFKYEQVPVNKFVSGVIEDIQRDENYVKKFQGKETVTDAVRFKFRLDGLQYARYSRWMTFNYSEKSNLYKKFLVPLVPNARPNMDYDLRNLIGKRINTFWIQNGEYQNLQLIVPADDATAVAANETTEDEEAPI